MDLVKSIQDIDLDLKKPTKGSKKVKNKIKKKIYKRLKKSFHLIFQDIHSCNRKTIIAFINNNNRLENLTNFNKIKSFFPDEIIKLILNYNPNSVIFTFDITNDNKFINTICGKIRYKNLCMKTDLMSVNAVLRNKCNNFSCAYEENAPKHYGNDVSVKIATNIDVIKIEILENTSDQMIQKLKIPYADFVHASVSCVQMYRFIEKIQYHCRYGISNHLPNRIDNKFDATKLQEIINIFLRAVSINDEKNLLKLNKLLYSSISEEINSDTVIVLTHWFDFLILINYHELQELHKHSLLSKRLFKNIYDYH